MKTLIPVFLRASAHVLWLTTIAIALVFGGSAPTYGDDILHAGHCAPRKGDIRTGITAGH